MDTNSNTLNFVIQQKIRQTEPSNHSTF